MAFKKNIESFSNSILQKESNHLMGTSQIIETYLQLSKHLKPLHRETLIYFLPLAAQIKKELKLVTCVFEKTLDIKKGNIKIQRVDPFFKSINHNSIKESRLGINLIVEGENYTSGECFIVEIKLSEGDELKDYLETGYKRELLKNFLCLKFLPENSECSTKLILDDPKRDFIISENNMNGRVGISSKIV